MHRRDILKMTGAAFAPTASAGCLAASEEHDLVEFEDSEELLLEPGLLPEDGWTQLERGGVEILDRRVTFEREVADETDGEGDDRWIVTSAAAGRATEAEATDLYDELHTAFAARVGDARLMDLELASEAAIAGYDGRTGVIFRDANCVAAVEFSDCTSPAGCRSHVDRGEDIARTKQDSWRDGPDAPAVDETEESATDQQDSEDQPEDEGDDPPEDGATDDEDSPVQEGDPSALELADYDILGDDPNEESITLRYAGEGALDMSNWRIEDDHLVPADSLTAYQFPSGFALDAGADVTIVTGEGSDADDTLYWGVGRQVWNEEGDVVYVFDANGDVVLQESIATDSADGEASDGDDSGDDESEAESPDESDDETGDEDPDEGSEDGGPGEEEGEEGAQTDDEESDDEPEDDSDGETGDGRTDDGAEGESNGESEGGEDHDSNRESEEGEDDDEPPDDEPEEEEEASEEEEEEPDEGPTDDDSSGDDPSEDDGGGDNSDDENGSGDA